MGPRTHRTNRTNRTYRTQDLGIQEINRVSETTRLRYWLRPMSPIRPIGPIGPIRPIAVLAIDRLLTADHRSSYPRTGNRQPATGNRSLQLLVFGADDGLDAAADVEVSLDFDPAGGDGGDEVVEDPIGDGFVEGAFVAEGPEVELE